MPVLSLNLSFPCDYMSQLAKCWSTNEYNSWLAPYRPTLRKMPTWAAVLSWVDMAILTQIRDERTLCHNALKVALISHDIGRPRHCMTRKAIHQTHTVVPTRQIIRDDHHTHMRVRMTAGQHCKLQQKIWLNPAISTSSRDLGIQVPHHCRNAQASH